MPVGRFSFSVLQLLKKAIVEKKAVI